MIGIVVQARMSSRRLPGKMLADLNGRSLLQRVLDRVCQVEVPVIVATSAMADDDGLARQCERHGVVCHRGPLADVAARMLGAARESGLHGFVRVCGDSPLIDPSLIRAGIARFEAARLDLVTNVHPRRYPSGQSVEVIDVKALERAQLPADDDDREHVTRPFYRAPQHWRLATFAPADDHSAVRMVVDTPEDLECMRGVYAQLRRDASSYTWEQLLPLFAGVNA